MSKSRAVILALCLILLALWLLTPGKLQGSTQRVTPPDNPDAWLASTEASVAEHYGLVPGTEKRITWFDEQRPTTYAVVYFHGFSATRQETAPLARLVAGALGANLFETRLAGHGRQREFLADVTAEDWLQDGVEALTIGAMLGQRIIVIGTSTGATLATALLDHPAMGAVDALVMLSPNFRPQDSNAAWLTRPAGPLLARALVGDTQSWEPHNELQARYWSTTYPLDSVVEMMRLVDRANRLLPAEIPQRLLLLYSNEDAVVSPEAALSVFEQTSAPQKAAIEIGDADDPSHHVLAGDVLSPASTRRIAADIVEFISRPVP